MILHGLLLNSWELFTIDWDVAVLKVRDLCKRLQPQHTQGNVQRQWWNFVTGICNFSINPEQTSKPERSWFTCFATKMGSRFCLSFVLTFTNSNSFSTSTFKKCPHLSLVMLAIRKPFQRKREQINCRTRSWYKRNFYLGLKEWQNGSVHISSACSVQLHNHGCLNSPPLLLISCTKLKKSTSPSENYFPEAAFELSGPASILVSLTDHCHQ